MYGVNKHNTCAQSANLTEHDTINTKQNTKHNH